MRTCLIVLVLVFCCAASALAVEVTLKDAGNVRLQLYGYVKADFTYDSQSTEPKSDTTMAFFVLPETAGEKDSQVRLGARESRIGLALFGPDVGDWKTTGKIERISTGAARPIPTPRIRLAFVDVAHSSGLAFMARLGKPLTGSAHCQFRRLADVGALRLRRPQARATQNSRSATTPGGCQGGGCPDGGPGSTAAVRRRRRRLSLPSGILPSTRSCGLNGPRGSPSPATTAWKPSIRP